MTNQTLEGFVNSIRNLYQKPPPTNANSSQQQQSTTTNSFSHEVNYTEVHNVITSHLNTLHENVPNLLDNVLPIFTLPEFTLPNMAVLYAITSQFEQSASNSNASLAQSPSTSVNINTTTAQKSISIHTDGAANLNPTVLSTINQEKLLNEVESCIQLSDERQVEVASDIYADLCHFYVNKLCQINKPKRGLPIIRIAIRKLQIDLNNGNIRVNQLTLVHADLLQLCLASKNFSLALELLSNEILDIGKPQNSSFDSKYLLSFFYYSGCIYAAMKQFDSALFFLEQSLTTPASVISQIMIESYKKFVLISLISKGKLPMLPKYTSRIVLNQIKPICSIYHDLAASFISYDQEKFNSLCQKYQDLFQQDRNLGLIKQLQQSFYKKNIQKLTKTFITLSLSDMAMKVKLPTAKDAENIMLNMIKDGEIFATINQKDGMVSFHDNPEKYDNPVVMENLTKQMFACIQMDSNIKQMDKDITTHPHYIQKCQNNLATSCEDSTVDHLLQSTNVTSYRQSQAPSMNA